MLRKRSPSSSSCSSTSLSQDDFDPALLPPRQTFQRKEAPQKCDDEPISDWEAGVSLAKAIMGAGSFALPWAFSKMGYVAGPLVLIVFLGLSVHSIGLLVDCAVWLRLQKRTQQRTQQRGGRISVSYVDVARSAFGTTGAAFAYASSIASSVGVCGSYLVFVSVNASALLVSSGWVVVPGDKNDERRLFLVLVWTVALPIAVLVSSVRDPKRFARVSLWGDLSVVAGMLAVVVYGVGAVLVAGEPGQQQQLQPPQPARDESATAASKGECVAIGSLGDMALALGSIGYLFLIHFLVLPIESSMARNDGDGDGDGDGSGGSESNLPDAEVALPAAPSAVNNRDRFQKVVTVTFIICGGIGGVFGIIGYVLFGRDTQQIVLLNIEGSMGMAIVQFLLCIDLLLTYPVVMRPSISILEEHWLSYLRKGKMADEHPVGDEEALQMMALVHSSPRDSSSTIPTTTTTIKSPSRWSTSCSKRPTSASGVLTGIRGFGGSSKTILPSDGSDYREDNYDNNNNNNNNSNKHHQETILGVRNHLAVCLILGVVAAGAGSFVPAFGLLSGLVGGVSQTFLAFVMPPLMWSGQQQQQQQPKKSDGGPGNNRSSKSSSGNNKTASVEACFRSLPWREKALVLCGLGLIGWTLQTTWAELGSSGEQ